MTWWQRLLYRLRLATCDTELRNGSDIYAQMWREDCPCELCAWWRWAEPNVSSRLDHTR